MLIRLLTIVVPFLVAGALQAQLVVCRMPVPGQDPKERAIAYRLKQPISLNFKDVPLRQAIKDIATQSGLQIVPDFAALQDERVNLDAPLSISVEDIEMRAALQILLQPMRLRFIIEDQVLRITTQDRGIRLVRKRYQVANLVQAKPILDGGKQGPSKADVLMALIQNAVAKQSWESNGGKATIAYCAIDKTFEICQCEEFHEEVRELLNSLIQLNPLTVSLDIKLLRVSHELTPRLRKSMGSNGNIIEMFQKCATAKQEDHAVQFLRAEPNCIAGSPVPFKKGMSPIVSFDETALAELLRSVRADRRSTLTQLPIAHVANGQKLPLECMQKQTTSMQFRGPGPEPFAALPFRDNGLMPVTKFDERILDQAETTLSGWRAAVQPVVAHDRKNVRLALECEHFVRDTATATDRSTKGACTLSKRTDGQTLIWYLGESPESEPSEREHLFVAVTTEIRENAGIVVTLVEPASKSIAPGR